MTNPGGYRKVIRALRTKRCGALACERTATAHCASCGRPLCGEHVKIAGLELMCAGCHPENHRPRGVMDGTATEPNRSEATPAPVL